MPTLAEMITEDELATVPTSLLIVRIAQSDEFMAFMKSASDYDLWAPDTLHTERASAAIEAMTAEIDRRIPPRRIA